MEKFYAFIKDSRVREVAVFASQDEELADSIAQQKGYDDAIWTDNTPVAIWSEYVNGELIPPTLDYLYSIGVVKQNQAMLDELHAIQEQQINNN